MEQFLKLFLLEHLIKYIFWGCLCVCLAWSIKWCGNVSRWYSLPRISNWQSYATRLDSV